ncbi:hypothetical protein Q8W26_15345 [Psychrobium sp. 1_MG-2023]|nr:hypothetical protein [Psychrobium sp. 1_MG-2023]MDP2562520.1 hypothetical protein [Psychrobium sp. 1_MG-2023]
MILIIINELEGGKMDEMNAVEWFGIFASVIIAYSLTLKDLMKLRSWNLLGASLLSVYGGLIGSMPVLLLNAFIALTNIYYLVQMRKASREPQAEE